MTVNSYIDPKNSLFLYGLENNFDFITSLYSSKKYPKILMLSGEKGIGKFTLVSHFLNFIFEKKHYDLLNKNILNESLFYSQFKTNSFPNAIYLAGDNFKNVKIEDIRELKSKLLKTPILDSERFIILDDVELFNINSLNALLKIIEEPTVNNFFILINNKTRPVIQTIHSRCFEYKINLNNKKRINVIENLIQINNLNVALEYKHTYITPGNFISFNDLINQYKIDLNDDLITNIEKILIIYKKDKNKALINFILYLTDCYFSYSRNKNFENLDLIIDKKNFIIENINKFLIYNLNQNSLINALNNKLLHG